MSRTVHADVLREEFIRLLTVDSPHHDARRRDFNQAVFMDNGQPCWCETTLDMITGKFDKALRNVERLPLSELIKRTRRSS